MKFKSLVYILFLIQFSVSAQVYRAERTKFHDLLHTKLEIKPDWSKQYLYGTATLTLKPYFYDQSQLELDAKGFDIQSVTMKNQPLKYAYDKQKLTIDLGKNFSRKDTFQVVIKYTAKPNELVVKGSQAITADKGLYFINPLGTEKDKPKQIWTQGETEASSCWFPTIDTPNEKTTQEIFLTVDNQYITLSNGKLISSTKNSDGTRTDYWKQDKPHAPYLFMIAVGEFKKVVDNSFKDFEVSYYVEPQYEKNALQIFGRTPEMIRFFENKLGMKYQWDKYAQIAVREYVSGAMENTTATIHGDFIQKDAHQLADDNDDGVIAHELFHHWFGDLVTAESWSNLPLNESFADYSEYLWAEHKYGKDEADLVTLNGMMAYFNEAAEKTVPLIRYYYNDKEDMFDSHSYAKGGRILHMLRKQVGDEAFFKALNVYLTKNAYKTAEISDLRKAFEEVTGEDMNWFFNQWFLSAGHPLLAVNQSFNNKKLILDITQKQDSTQYPIYKLPLKVEIWHNNQVQTKNILVDETHQVFEFPIEKQPDLVLIDPEFTLVGFIQHQKPKTELLFQAKNATNFARRLEALEILTAVSETDSTAQNPLADADIRKLLLDATQDKFWRIRQFAVQHFRDYDGDDFLEVEKALQSRIHNEPRSLVRADAILAMKNFMNPQNDLLFRKALSDTSYTVQAAALEAILLNKPNDSEALVQKYKDSKIPALIIAVGNQIADEAKPESYPWFEQNLNRLSNSDLYSFLSIFGSYLVKSDKEIQQKSIPILTKFAQQNSQFYVRYAGVQALALLAEDKKVKELLKEIISQETDERLKNAYKQFQNL